MAQERHLRVSRFRPTRFFIANASRSILVHGTNVIISAMVPASATIEAVQGFEGRQGAARGTNDGCSADLVPGANMSAKGRG